MRHPSAFLQHAYALFLSLGHHDSHARRVNQVLCQSMDAAMKALAEHIPEFECTPAQGGASLWVKTPDWLDGGELAVRAREHGVLVEPGDVFFAQPPRPCPCFRLRLSSIDVGQIEAGVRALREAANGMGRERRQVGLLQTGRCQPTFKAERPPNDVPAIRWPKAGQSAMSR